MCYCKDKKLPTIDITKKQQPAMNSLKLVITFCATIFITTGVMAHASDETKTEIPVDSSLVEKTKVSAAHAASLFNFNTLPKKRKKSATKKTEVSSFHFVKLVESYL